MTRLEWTREMSRRNRGRRHSEETRRKIGDAHRGKPLSAEHRAKLSVSHSGEHHGNWGKHLSHETCLKIAKSKRGKPRSIDTRAKLSAANCGKHHSAETRAKMSEAGKGERHHNWGVHFSPDECVRMREMAVRAWQNPEFRERGLRNLIGASRVRPTGIERRMRTLLDARFPGEWKYVGNGEVIIGNKNPDFVNINGRKAVIEVFGDYWHSEEKTGVPLDQHAADRITHFAKYGFNCLVIWEHEMHNKSAVLEKVEAFCAS